jgi:hypothetical protein
MELFSHFNYYHHATGGPYEGVVLPLTKNLTARTLYLKIDEDYKNYLPGQEIELLVGASVCAIDDVPSKKKAREICQAKTNKTTMWKVYKTVSWVDVDNQSIRHVLMLRSELGYLTIFENMSMKVNFDLMKLVRASRI